MVEYESCYIYNNDHAGCYKIYANQKPLEFI